MRIMQGDEYKIPVTIRAADGTVITDSMVEIVEITVGFLKKMYPSEITYSDGRWLFPLAQEESFKMHGTKQPVQVRVKFRSGEVVGASAVADVTPSVSKEVL